MCPTHIKKPKALSSAVQVQCETNRTVVLCADGTVYASGKNSKERIGLLPEASLSFTQIPQLKSIVKISCGPHHMLALDNEQHVFSSGDNKHGALGHQAKTGGFS